MPKKLLAEPRPSQPADTFSSGLASKHLDWTLTFESLWTSSLWQERLGGLLGAKEGPS